MKNFTNKQLFNFPHLLAVALLFMANMVLAQVNVSGKVTGTNGEALPGVTVQEKGTTNGTSTDNEGMYSLRVGSSGAVIVFSYTGMTPYEMKVGGRDAYDVELTEDASQLSDLIVTASRLPVRKLETTTAVEVLGQKELQKVKAESFTEAVRAVPGVFVNTSQGRRGGIITRGFPDGNPLGGLVYTTVMLDGIPTFGTVGRLPDAGFGFDLNLDRVEFVRGSAATLFGRASAAGALNMITRTGGDKLGGTVRVTYYDDILGGDDFGYFTDRTNYRADVNLNGKITKNLRFNVGGWYLDDEGYRKTGAKDEGYQFRANLDYMLPNKRGSIRAYGGLVDFNFQNLTDVALVTSTLKLANGWKNTDTYSDPVALGRVEYKIREGSGATARDVLVNGQPVVRKLSEAIDRGNYAEGFHAGAILNLNLGSGFTLNNHFRMQTIETGTKYGFALPSFYPSSKTSRLFLDGDAEDKDLINELRISKLITGDNTRHNLSGGVYYSSIDLLPTTWSYLYGSSTNPNSIILSNAFAPLPAPSTGSITRRGDYNETVLGFFAGDEMKFNKLTLMVGARFDKIDLDMKETKRPYDSTMVRKESFSDWSASVGANYLLGARSAVYGNVVRAFRMPDYTAFTSLEKGTPGKFLRAPDGINDNEVIYNAELGYRTGFKDFSADLAVFYSQINNRLASIFENGLLVSKPLGQNQITGTELSMTLAPSGCRGLLLRTSITYQEPKFTDFKIPVSKATNGTPNVNPDGNLYGNTLIKEAGTNNYSIDLNGKYLPGVPRLIFNFLASYDRKHFGADFSLNANEGRYTDATNLIELGTIAVANAGFYFNLPLRHGSSVRLGVQAKNLFNSEDVQGIAGTADNDGVLIAKQRSPDFKAQAYEYAHGYIQLPRRFLTTLTYSF